MVQDLTFTRPEAWKWAEVKTSSPQVRLELRPGTKMVAAVTFTVYERHNQKAGVTAEVRRWKDSFDEKNLKITQESQVVGSCKLTYIEMSGSYRYLLKSSKRERLVPGYSLLGAVLERSSGSIVVRLQAPESVATDSKELFRKMIDDALKEEIERTKRRSRNTE